MFRLQAYKVEGCRPVKPSNIECLKFYSLIWDFSSHPASQLAFWVKPPTQIWVWVILGQQFFLNRRMGKPYSIWVLIFGKKLHLPKMKILLFKNTASSTYYNTLLIPIIRMNNPNLSLSQQTY